MKDTSINEGFPDRIEFVEKLLKQCENCKQIFKIKLS